MSCNPGWRSRFGGGVRASPTGLPGEWGHQLAEQRPGPDRLESAAQNQRSPLAHKATFVDGLDGVDEVHEDVADRFAEDQLIPPAAAQKLQGLRSEQEVKDAARALGIAPGIVVGRMQHERWLPRTHLNGLKVSYQWPEHESDD